MLSPELLGLGQEQVSGGYFAFSVDGISQRMGCGADCGGANRFPTLWVTSDDYPSEALKEDQEGVVGFRAGIGRDGLVTACAITQGSGSAILDATTCRLVTSRAKFKPAYGSDGKPTTGTYSGRVRWALPEDSDGVAETNSYITFVRSARGDVTQCHGSRFGSTLRDEDALSICQAMAAKFPIIAGPDGKPAAKRYTLGTIFNVADP